MKRIKCSDDVEQALQAAHLEWESKNGQNSHELKDGTGRIMWQDGQEFSEPMSSYMTGVLKTFGIIAFIAMVVFATWATM